MRHTSTIASLTVPFVAASLLLAAGSSACAGQLSTKPGVYDVRKEDFSLPRGKLTVTLVTPKAPKSPTFLVLFATGDAGWMGASGDVVEHIAERGCYLVAFNSRDVVKHVKSIGGATGIPDAALAVDSLIAQSRRALGLPESTPVIITGYSRGANLVVFTAGVKSLQQHVGGAVAIALTRETDFLSAPAADKRPAALQVDEKGRIQTYPAIALAGPIPFAVIQSKGDDYVPAEEARRLFGPDSETRKLFEVDAKNHGFSGGKDELLRDLDEALTWIESKKG